MERTAEGGSGMRGGRSRTCCAYTPRCRCSTSGRSRLAKFKAPFPLATFWIGQGMEFVGCALVLFNFSPAVGVVLLLVFTIVASALLLRFWEVEGPMRTGLQNGMLANIGIVGGLLLLLQHVR